MSTPQRTCRLIAALAVVVAAATGWYAHAWVHGRSFHGKERRVTIKGYRLTSPLLDVELPEGVKVDHEPISFKHDVEQVVARQIQAGHLSHAAVYFRDLHDGPWFGINVEREFDPASMMKVAVMIAWMKRAESDRNVLRQQFRYEGSQDLASTQTIRPQQTLVAGTMYSVENLLKYMLNYSDNNATSLLYEQLTPQEMNDVLDGMDVRNNPKSGHNSVTVHGFSGFFRILYNASYLNREMSEKALSLLSLDDFPQGIAAGVPPGVVIATKYGEVSQGGGGKQLHEFGIVYHPKGHYILGVMTEGRNLSELAGVLREVSRTVYDAVNRSAPP